LFPLVGWERGKHRTGHFAGAGGQRFQQGADAGEAEGFVDLFSLISRSFCGQGESTEKECGS